MSTNEIHAHRDLDAAGPWEFHGLRDGSPAWWCCQVEAWPRVGVSSPATGLLPPENGLLWRKSGFLGSLRCFLSHQQPLFPMCHFCAERTPTMMPSAMLWPSHVTLSRGLQVRPSIAMSSPGHFVIASLNGLRQEYAICKFFLVKSSKSGVYFTLISIQMLPFSWLDLYLDFTNFPAESRFKCLRCSRHF